MTGNKWFGFKTYTMMVKDGSFTDMKPVWNKDMFLFLACGFVAKFLHHELPLQGSLSGVVAYAPFLLGILVLWIVRRETFKHKKWWSGIYFISFIVYDVMVLFLPVLGSWVFSLFV